MFGWRLACLYGLLLIFAAATGARADTLWIGTGANPIPYDQVQILRIEGGNLVYATSGGTETTKPLSEVQQIGLDNNATFSAGETAYRAGEWADAADAYEKSLNDGSNKDWIKDRSALRLVDAAAKAGRFDRAVAGYIALVSQDAAWAKNKPALPTDSGSDQLNSAAAALSSAADNSSLSNDRRSALLALLLDVYRFQKDTAKANQTLGRLADLGGASPDEIVGLKVDQAQAALDAKDYAKARDMIQGVRSSISDPAEQIDALYILARCQDGLADNGDANQIKDAALAYMRVVTFGKDVPGRPHAADSLLRIAWIHEEKLKDEKPAALQLYNEIVTHFKNTPAALQAAEGIERLRKAS